MNMKSQHHSSRSKIPWYWAPGFFAFWIVLFFGVVLPHFNKLPVGINIANEHFQNGRFIAERAEIILRDFEAIGPKVIGSFANENQTVQLLYNEVTKIRAAMQEDLFDMDIDLQLTSGAYMHWPMVNMYQGLQNFIVRLKPKLSSNGISYLLINSHFDSKPGSPASGDDGAMLVVMLEILRVIATSRHTFRNPIVFLFNGGEENSLQASHGFVMQHRWAKNCKALINLDSAGSGHKEILFQSGPNNPWLMNYYRKHVVHPYAQTVAEEIFQSNLIPSDTDFRIFRDFGRVPGLDFAHSYNGYVYHTKFDRMDVIPRGTLQNTGDNILALARALSNASELEDTSSDAAGHAVFFDFLGQFIILYTEVQGKIINTSVAIVAFIVITISMWKMSTNSKMPLRNVFDKFIIVFSLHVVGFILSVGLPLTMAYILDETGIPMTWFTTKWMVVGLYIFPTFFGLAIPTSIYLHLTKNDKLNFNYRTQMILHAHCIILATFTLTLTYIEIRSAYMFMLAVFFYESSLIINLATKLQDKFPAWSIAVAMGQILPFIYFTYILYAFLCSVIPIMGRFGSSRNPDFFISGLCALFMILSMGFVIPLVNIFSKARVMLAALLVVSFGFIIIANSHYGFPYRPKTNVKRIHCMNVRRVFYEADMSVSKNESGYYFDLQDRRKQEIISSSFNVSHMKSIVDDCNMYTMCGLPLFKLHESKARKDGVWIKTEEATVLPGLPKLKLLQKTANYNTSTVRYDFQLSGPSHMSIFLQPMLEVTTIDWSFLETVLTDNWKPPYQIFFTYGKDSTPLKFHFVLKVKDGNFFKPLFEMGISAHYINWQHRRSPANQAFIDGFPKYSFIVDWPSSYERYIF